MLTILKPHCKPIIATTHSAGIDLKAANKTILEPQMVTKVPLGVKIDRDYMFDDTHYFALHIRSGHAAKGLMLANGVGVIDIDYPDEWAALIYNTNETPFLIEAGERIAQVILLKRANYYNHFEVKNTRTGGFGSSGR